MYVMNRCITFLLSTSLKNTICDSIHPARAEELSTEQKLKRVLLANFPSELFPWTSCNLFVWLAELVRVE